MRKGDISSASIQITAFISDYVVYFWIVNHLDIGDNYPSPPLRPNQSTGVIVSITCICYSCCQLLNSYICGVLAKMVILLDSN